MIRFWFENPGRFTKQQLKQINKVTFARILCDSSDDIKTLPKQAFDFIPVHSFTKCEDIPQMDMKAWKDFRKG